LWATAREGLTGEVLRLIEDGADIDEPGGPSDMTPLHIAVFQNHTDAVRLLLRKGAEASTADYYGTTPLHR
ncbi:ankyrin repeat-containing domain protein, partial [Baffinella frigidus]